MRKRHVILVILLFLALYLYVSNIRVDDISIEPLKKYPHNCIPCESELRAMTIKKDTVVFCDQPPVLPDAVVKVLDKRRIDAEYSKWVLYVYLRLYEKQLLLNSLSSETRETPYFFKRFGSKSALSRAFCEVTGQTYLDRKFGPEFLPALKSYDFVSENKLFTTDTDIQKQMKLIDNLRLERMQSCK